MSVFFAAPESKRFPRLWRTSRTVAILLLAVALSSCATDSEVSNPTSSVASASVGTTPPDPTQATTTTVTTGRPTETAETQACESTDPIEPRPGPLLELLRHVPNGDEYRQAIYFNHVSLFNSDTGTELPDPKCDDAILAYAEASFEGMGLFPGGPGGSPSEVIEAELVAWGFSYLDHAAVVLAGPPASPLRLRLVDVDRERVAEAVTTDADWADDVLVVDEMFFDWGRSIDFDRESPARPFGRGGSLAVLDGIVVQADDVQIAAASVDASDQGTGLDNDPDFNALAVEFDKRGVHAAFLTQEVAFPVAFEIGENYDPGSVRDLIAAFPFLPKPGAVALGWTEFEDGGAFTVALSATTPTEAQVMVDAIVARAQTEIPEINYSYGGRFTVTEAAVVDSLAVVVMTAEQRVWLDRVVLDLFLAPSN